MNRVDRHRQLEQERARLQRQIAELDRQMDELRGEMDPSELQQIDWMPFGDYYGGPEEPTSKLEEPR